jgi:Recombination directionality factor-like
MAIRRPGATQVRLPEIGRIFKGSPKQINPKKNDGSLMQGSDLDYFRFEPAASTHDLPSPDNNGTLAEYLVRQYAELGDAPRALPIQFLHSEVEKDFNAEHNEAWAKIGGVERCITRCDGAIQKLHLVEQNGKKMLSNARIPCAAAEGMNKCPLGCKPTGRLFFIMPCLNYPGLVILTTHSIYDILEIEGNLAMYSNWDINKIPFQLCRTEKTISRTNDDGSKTPMKKWLCHLSIDPRFGNAVLAAQPKQYYAELTGGIEWDAEFVDITPQTELPSAAEVPALEAAKTTPQKTGQQKIVARICAVAKEAGFTEAARDAMLAEGNYASKNDVPDAELVVGWFTPENAAVWNAQYPE